MIGLRSCTSITNGVGDALDMREQRLRGQTREEVMTSAISVRGHDENGSPGAVRRQCSGVSACQWWEQIGLEVPVFLIYARQAVEDLARQMACSERRSARAGQQVVQLPVVEHPQDVIPRRKLRPSCDSSIWRTTFLSPTSCTKSMRSCSSSSSARWLQRRGRCSGRLARTLAAPRLRLRVSQPSRCMALSRERTWRRAAQHLRQRLQRGVGRFTVATLPQTDELLLQSGRGHKEERSCLNVVNFLSLYYADNFHQ